MSDDEDIVETEGRKPYNRAILRLAREEAGYINRAPKPDYVSHQSLINSGPGGTIDEEELANYLNERSYEEIKPKNVDQIPVGSRIAYITKKNKWRSAGWLARIEESTMDVDGNEFTRPKKYVLYKSYNNACFPVQVEDVRLFYILQKKVEVVIEKMIYFRKPVKQTKFPVTLINSEREEIVVYYARDNFNKKLFESSMKFLRAQEDPDGWQFEDGTQENDSD